MITRLGGRRMFEVNSAEAQAPVQELGAAKPEESAKPASGKRTKSKPKAKTFDDLQKLVSEWQPSDPKASRRMLSSEIMHLLEDNGFTYIKACIPSVIVEGQFPIDLIHYHTDQDIYEFLTRMMWMHQEYGKALGIMIGVKDEGTVTKFEDACDSLLISEKDCLVILI
jgi:hypothetical protein